MLQGGSDTGTVVRPEGGQYAWVSSNAVQGLLGVKEYLYKLRDEPNSQATEAPM